MERVVGYSGAIIDLERVAGADGSCGWNGPCVRVTGQTGCDDTDGLQVVAHTILESESDWTSCVGPCNGEASSSSNSREEGVGDLDSMGSRKGRSGEENSRETHIDYCEGIRIELRL